MGEYRWNVAELAAGYDAAAPHIHPHYFEIQNVILNHLAREPRHNQSVVDIGGGSGRLVERILEREPRGRARIVDQSSAFLALAERRLARFGDRCTLQTARLQEHWDVELAEPPTAIVSMSAIHHLDPMEKQQLYRRCHDRLAPGGIFMNGDEVRPPDDSQYLACCRAWSVHMRNLAEAQLVSEPMRQALMQWEVRNVHHFGTPRVSGDDCHETIAVQLDYLRTAGFAKVSVVWERAMWGVLYARRADA